MADRDTCAELAGALPEVATGAATGADRGQVLRHVAGCARCRLELEGLARTADDLLPLVPEREPPAGFEAAVLARLEVVPSPLPAPAVARRVRRPRRWSWPVSRPARRLAVGAAAGLLAVLAAGALTGGLVWRHTAPDRQLAGEYRQTLAVGDGSYLRAAPVTADGGVVGHLYAYQGRPSWVYVTVTDAPAPGRYEVRLVARDGRQWQLGPCLAASRYCGAGATIQIPVDQISAVRLEQPSGPGMVAQLS